MRWGSLGRPSVRAGGSRRAVWPERRPGPDLRRPRPPLAQAQASLPAWGFSNFCELRRRRPPTPAAVKRGGGRASVPGGAPPAPGRWSACRVWGHPTRLAGSTWVGAWGRSGACSGVRAEDGKTWEGAGKRSPFPNPLGTRRAPTTPPEKRVFLLKQQPGLGKLKHSQDVREMNADGGPNPTALLRRGSGWGCRAGLNTRAGCEGCSGASRHPGAGCWLSAAHEPWFPLTLIGLVIAPPGGFEEAEEEAWHHGSLMPIWGAPGTPQGGPAEFGQRPSHTSDP